jgi:NAD(P)-dependent dehydrogenase (short-subunit alcohol dehydrogenase family)
MFGVDLSGQVFVVTGGASGIGQAIVELCASLGADCVAVDKKPLDASPWQSGSVKRPDEDSATGSNSRVRYLQLDLADCSATLSALGGLEQVSVLVNNAGMLGPARLLHETPLSHVEASWAVNLRGAIVASQAVLPIMRRQGRGVIVNISSISAYRGSAADPVYAAMKAGLLGLTRSLASQYGPHGIRVVAICPGSVRGTRLTETARGHGLTQQEVLGLIQRLPLRRTVLPQDVASLVVFLTSPLAAAVTGSATVIDAGEAGWSP